MSVSFTFKSEGPPARPEVYVPQRTRPSVHGGHQCCARRVSGEAGAERCVFFMGMPQSIYSDNQSIISNDFISTLCELAGAEYHTTVPYRPQSNGQAERAVQSVICLLRQFLEQRGKGKHNNWVTSFRLALWGLNDLPGAVHQYSPHQLVFGREPIGWGDCPPYVDEEGCEDAGAFFRRLVQERDAVRDKLHAIHEREYRKFLKAHHSFFALATRFGSEIGWILSLFTPSSTGCGEGLLRSLQDSPSRHIG